MIFAFLLIVHWPGESLSDSRLSSILAAIAFSVLGLFLLQQLSGRWIFNGGHLYFSSFFVAAEYQLSEFSTLSASHRKRGRVLSLCLASEYQYGESLEFWFRDWKRQSLCELMHAILKSNSSIQVNPNLAHIIFLWAKQAGLDAESVPAEAELLAVEDAPEVSGLA